MRYPATARRAARARAAHRPASVLKAACSLALAVLFTHISGAALAAGAPSDRTALEFGLALGAVLFIAGVAWVLALWCAWESRP